MSRYIVYGEPTSPHVRGVLFALAEKGAAYRTAPREAAPILRTAENGAYGEPVLEAGGTIVRGAETVLRYIEDGFLGPNLQPEAAADRARMNHALELYYREAVITLGSRIVGRYIAAIIASEWLDPIPTEAVLSAARGTIARYEALLSHGSYLAGSVFSLADIALSSLLDNVMDLPDGDLILSADSPIRQWWTRVSARPAFLATKPKQGLLFGFMHAA